MDQREQQEGGPSVARRSSRESRGYSANQSGSGLMNGEAIVVNMSRLADVLGETGGRLAAWDAANWPQRVRLAWFCLSWRTGFIVLARSSALLVWTAWMFSSRSLFCFRALIKNTDVAVNRTRVPRFPCLRPAYCMVCIPCLGRVQSPIQERRTAAVSGTRGGLWPVVGWRLWRFFRKTNETTPVPRFRQMTDQVTSGGGWDPLGSLSTAAAEPTPRCLSWDDPALEVCPLCFQPTVNAFA